MTSVELVRIMGVKRIEFVCMTCEKGLNMKHKPQAWVIMLLIAMSAAFLLGTTNEITSDMIYKHSLEEKEKARSLVFPEAENFAPILLDGTEAVEECYTANKDGEVIGYVCTASEQGYGGPIQVIVGIRPDGGITGITVGGSRFAETAGLGAKTKESSFSEQFIGKRSPLSLKMDIDAVTGASISSGAVVKAANKAAAFVKERTEGDAK